MAVVRPLPRTAGFVNEAEQRPESVVEVPRHQLEASRAVAIDADLGARPQDGLVETVDSRLVDVAALYSVAQGQIGDGLRLRSTVTDFTADWRQIATADVVFL